MYTPETVRARSMLLSNVSTDVALKMPRSDRSNSLQSQVCAFNNSPLLEAIKCGGKGQ